MDKFLQFISEFDEKHNDQKWCEEFYSYINDNSEMLNEAINNTPNLPFSMERLEEIMEVIENSLSIEYRIAHKMSLQFDLGKLDYSSMNKYKEHVISQLENSDGLKEDESKNKELLKFCLENNLMDKLFSFHDSILTSDILNEYKDRVISAIKSYSNYPLCGINIFKFSLENNVLNEHNLLQFNPIFYTKSLLDQYKEQFFKCLSHGKLENDFETLDMLEFSLQNNITNIINQFINNSLFTRNVIEKYKDQSINYFSKVNDKNIIQSIGNKYEIIEFCLENDIDNIIQYIFDDFLSIVNSDFVKKHKDHIKAYFIKKGLPAVRINNIELYKMFIREDLINVHIDKELAIYKLEYLYRINDDVLRDINFDILQYDFDLSFLNRISMYRNIQERIISLNNNSLNIFYRVAKLLNDDSIDLSSVIVKYLNNISKYEHLLTNVEISNLTDDEINNFLEIIELDCDYGIKDVIDLKSENFIEKKNKYFDSLNLKMNNCTLDEIKESIFIKQFGITLADAKFIYERYSYNYEDLIKAGLDEKIIKILRGIEIILNCTSREKLIELYQNVDSIKPDYKNGMRLEPIIRKHYAEMYSKSLYKIDEKSKRIDHPLLKNLTHDGKIIDVYEADEDFSMQIHILGGFVSLSEEEANYKTAWNRPKTMWHGFCTSYITNGQINPAYIGDGSQITPANLDNPIIGFSEYEGSALLSAGNRDLASNIHNIDFDVSSNEPHKVLPPKVMINATRCGYNEMILERCKKFGSEAKTTIKRQPSYVVYIVDTMENEENFSKDNELYQRTLKVASDFNIPIVIIDRSKHAIREMAKCQSLEEKFKKTHDLEVLEELFMTYFNNNIGSKFFTKNPKYEKYNLFTDESVSAFYNRIGDFVMNEITRDEEKVVILFKLKNILEKDLSNYKVEHHSPVQNKPPFDFEKAIIKLQETIIELQTRINNNMEDDIITEGRSR